MVEAVPPADVDELKALLASGAVRPAIDRQFPLAETREALKWVNDGHSKGKVIITME